MAVKAVTGVSAAHLDGVAPFYPSVDVFKGNRHCPGKFREGIVVSDLGGEATDHHVGNSAIGVADVDVGNSQAGGCVVSAVVVLDGEPVAYHAKMELIYLRRADHFCKVAGD